MKCCDYGPRDQKVKGGFGIPTIVNNFQNFLSRLFFNVVKQNF